jgi:serine/threonine-protein kinase RsbW
MPATTFTRQMAGQNEKRLLSALPATEFFGRDRELDACLLHSWSTGGLRILSPPWGGATELLRQTADRLFFDSSETIPFYFCFREADRSACNAAVRFLQEFLVQTVAYRRRDPAVYVSSPEICELSSLVPASDSDWFEKLIEKCEIDSPAKDDRSFVRNCLSAPLRVASSGARIFVMLDDVHHALEFEEGRMLAAEIADVFSRAAISYAVAARRRFSVPGLLLPTLELEDLSGSRAGQFVSQMADVFDIAVTDQTRDLIAAQTGGRPGFIRALFLSARAHKRALDSFQHVEQVYVDEVLKGRLGGFYRDVLSNATRSPVARRELIRLLHDGLGSRGQLDIWQKRTKLAADELRQVVDTLDAAEVISVDGTVVRVAAENHIFADTIRSRFQIECSDQPRAVAAGEIMAAAMKRAPRLMSHLYRRLASVGLINILSSFDCQEVPQALLDYRRFRTEFKGLSDNEIDARLSAETERVMLPQVVHTAPADEYQPRLSDTIEPERAVVAIGFNDQSYTDDGQVVWIAAEIDSKVEADRETAEIWCERLEQLAQVNGFAKYRIWLVATEGFTDGALDALAERRAIGSSRRQAVLLRDRLGAGGFDETAAEGVEYEMVIPVGEDTELIAAHALEEIARRHKFPPKSINQLKTALVEACINAAEHGLAPDRKIHQRFVVGDDKITISISNRGIRLADKLAAETEEQQGPFPVESPDTRRGWGLNLIRGLMDDVRVEPVDDGTRITMTKFLRDEARV